MQFTQADLHRIAKLARLRFADAQSQAYVQHLQNFLQIVEQMQAVDTDGVEALAHPLSMIEQVHLPLAPDAAQKSDMTAVIEKIAPSVENRWFIVPKVIE